MLGDVDEAAIDQQLLAFVDYAQGLTERIAGFQRNLSPLGKYGVLCNSSVLRLGHDADLYLLNPAAWLEVPVPTSVNVTIYEKGALYFMTSS